MFSRVCKLHKQATKVEHFGGGQNSTEKILGEILLSGKISPEKMSCGISEETG